MIRLGRSLPALYLYPLLSLFLWWGSPRKTGGYLFNVYRLTLSRVSICLNCQSRVHMCHMSS